ncbi:MAG TPA: ABC transporter permease [Anaeromyxobacteraceae bacterium]|nr:ABC transporter permease [Anaeromyxobacteraceae bacterium]
MTSRAPGGPLAGSAEVLTCAVDFARQALAVADAELHKLFRDPTELFTRSVQPILWLLVFGQVFTRTHAIPTGGLTYLDFMAPGVLAQSILFTSIFFGIAIIWERDLGILQKTLVTPAYRGALVLGKGLSAGVRALAQSALVVVVTLVLGVRLRAAPLPWLGVVVAVLFGAAAFSTFSLVVACLVKTRERFMGIGQVLTMPLFFASNAIYPIDLMPGWLRVVARLNPLTYLVDGLRALMVEGAASAFGLGTDLAVQAGVLVLLVALAARLYPTVAV